MNCRIIYCFVIFVLVSLTDGVKVNMQGSISLGKDVMETLTHYIRRNMDGRRSMSFPRDNDRIHTLLKDADICRGLHFCDIKLEKFMIDYVRILARAIEGIFEGILNVNNELIEQNQLVFEDEFKMCINDIKTILKQASTNVTDRAYTWITIIKKVSAIFQEKSINFVIERLDGKPEDIDKAKNKLTHKLVIATIMVEGKFESKLCSDHQICPKSYECSTALNTLLRTFKDNDDEVAKSFIRSFYGTLSETNFFSVLSEVTSKKFQIILNDMAYTDNVPTRTVLLTLQKTIQAKIDSISSRKHNLSGRDVELLYVIMSDLDHIYRKRTPSDLHNFLRHYSEWLQTGGRLTFHIRQLLNEIKNQLLNETPEVLKKLTHEVRIFMEITVDPEV